MTPPKKGIRFEMSFGQLVSAVLVFVSVFIIPSYVITKDQNPNGKVAGMYTESFYEAQAEVKQIGETINQNGGLLVTLDSIHITLLQGIIMTIIAVVVALIISSMIRYYKVTKKIFEE